MTPHLKAALWGIAFAVLVVAIWTAAHWDPMAVEAFDGDASYPGGRLWCSDCRSRAAYLRTLTRDDVEGE